MIASQRIALARAEACAVNGQLLVAIGSLRRYLARIDGKQTLSAEMISDAIAEARAALNRFEDACHVEADRG